MTHPLVKLRVELSTVAPALGKAIRFADIPEVPKEEGKKPEQKEADAEELRAKDQKRAEKELNRLEKEARKEIRRQDKELKKALKKEQKAKQAQERAAVPQVPASSSPVASSASVTPSSPVTSSTPVTMRVESPPAVSLPPAESVAVPIIPLALPVNPASPQSLLAPELEAKLQLLSSMGFTDRQHNCMVLSRFDGDLQRVLDALLYV
jgi:hypothetical protein